MDGGLRRRAAVAAVPGRRGATGVLEHHAVDRHHLARGLGGGNERGRAEQAVVRVLPARQRLGRHHAAVRQRDDRLEVGDQLAGRDRRGDLVGAGRTREPRRLHLGPPDAHLALAGLLGAVHGHVGLADQLVGAERPGTRGRDADRSLRPYRDVADGNGRRQQLQHARRDVRAVGVVDVLEQDGELVAAEPGGDVGGAHAGADALGDLDQHRVTRRVPAGGAPLPRSCVHP